MRTRIHIVAIACLLALSVGGCGVRGSLDAPADNAIDNVEGPAGRDDGRNEHDSFVLDGLIR